MAKSKKQECDTPKIRPALTPEARENQMISLAIDLVEERLRNGTASSQETTHFLKLASTKARLEKEVMKKQMELMDAKTESYKSNGDLKRLYTEALDAFRIYSGATESVDDENEEY